MPILTVIEKHERSDAAAFARWQRAQDRLALDLFGAPILARKRYLQQEARRLRRETDK